MQRLMLASLFTFALATTAPAVNAETTAFDVVNLARNGYLRHQGIPSHARLAADARTNQISAEEVVRAAIAAGRLDETNLNDRFISAVDAQLTDLSDR